MNSNLEIELTANQLRLWIEWKKYPQSTSHYAYIAQKLIGDLDVEWFVKCTNKLLANHQVFQAQIVDKSGLPVIHIKEKPTPLELISLDDANTDFERNYEKQIENYLINNSRLLAESPCKIALFFTKKQNRYYFVASLPHILIDGYSCDLLLQELSHLYNRDKEEIRYNRNQIIEARQYNKKNIEYWSNIIKESEILPVQFPKANSNNTSSNGHRIYKTIPRSILQNIIPICKDHRTTKFVFLASIFAYTLYRYTQQDRFSILYPINFRNKDQKNQIGFAVDLLPLSFNFNEYDSFIDLLKHITKQRIEHKDNSYEYERILELINFNESQKLNVIFSQTTLLSKNLKLKNIDISTVRIKKCEPYNDLSLLYDIDDEKILLQLEYSLSLNDGFSSNILEHFEYLLSKIPEQITNNINTINYFDVSKVIGFRKTYSSNIKTKYKYLAEIIRSNSNQNGERIAISSINGSISYSELYQKVKVISNNLRNIVSIDDAKVAVIFDRNISSIATIIACVDINLTFIPIDPSFPIEKIIHILNDSKCRTIIYDDERHQKFQSIEIANKIKLSDLAKSKDSSSNHSEPFDADIMYIMYTSGTTGLSKGAAINQSALLELLENCNELFDFNFKDKWSCCHSLAFDFSVWEIWGALYHGAEIVIVPDNVKGSPAHFFDFILKNNISVLNLTPTAFKYLSYIASENSKFITSLRYIIFGGEKLNYSIFDSWLKKYDIKSPKLINMYGLTEATIHATIYQIQLDDINSSKSIIGTPLPNIECCVIDKHDQFAPENIAGELCLSGNRIIKNYLNGINSDKFISLNFKNHKNNIYYKTGDIVRWLPGGILEYIGRKDHQVKYHGYRIELDEIDYHLKKCDFIIDAASVLLNAETLKPEIIAFCVRSKKNTDFDDAKIYEYLNGKLPSYMHPSKLIYLDKLPITSQGKLNIQELHSILNNQKNSDTHHEVNIHALPKLQEVWRNILKVKSINIDTNFFDVGGNSILLIKLHNELEKLNGKPIPYNEMYRLGTIRKQADYLRSSNNPEKKILVRSKLAEKKNHDNYNDIAVIGMAAKVPGANNISQFWDNLLNGRESITKFSKDELILAGIDQCIVSLPNYITAKGCIDNAEYFDPKFFHISPRNAEILDPQQRIFLMEVWNALENAGYTTEENIGKIGVFSGQSDINTYLNYKLQHAHDLRKQLGDYQIFINNSSNFISSRISYCLNFTGPSVSIQTGCSTSLVAICQAAQSLLNNDCNLAVAGGAAISMPLKSGYLYQPGMILSKDGHCRPFSSEATGTVPSNGVGVVILKRLSDAISDSDKIYAVIKGFSVNNDGGGKLGFTAPSLTGQIDSISTAIENAKVCPKTIEYVEAHGTGTIQGDPVEIEALTAIYGKNNLKKTCGIGSVKSNIGHLDSAAGVVGFIKTVLSLNHQKLVKTLHADSLNSAINWDESPFYILNKTIDWKSPEYNRRAAVSSFAIGGTNAHVILEEYPEQKQEQSYNYEESSLIALSAPSPENLKQACHSLIEYLDYHPDTCIQNIAYTLQIGRRQFNYRYHLLAKNNVELVQKLKITNNSISKISSSIKKRNLCFIFPGQGQRYINVWQLYYKYELFKEQIDKCLSILNRKHHFDMSDWFTQLSGNMKASYENNTSIQLYIFILEYSFAQFFIKIGVKPDYLFGHSLGEYVAACIAGVWSLEDAISIVFYRQEFTKLLPNGKMIIVHLSEEEIRKYLPTDISIACINSENRSVLSGTVDSMDKLCMLLESKKVAFQILNINYPFHSHHIDKIFDFMFQKLKLVKFNEPKIPFISNLTGTWITAEEACDPHYWLKQMREMVLFDDGLQTLFNSDMSTMLEIGTEPVFISTISKTLNINEINYCFSSEEDNLDEDLLNCAGKIWSLGYGIDWNKLQNMNSQLQKIPIYTSPFKLNKYWIKNNNQESRTKSSEFNLYTQAWVNKANNNSEIISKEAEFLFISNKNLFFDRLIENLQSKNNLCRYVNFVNNNIESISNFNERICFIYPFLTKKYINTTDLSEKDTQKEISKLNNLINTLKSIAALSKGIKINFFILTNCYAKTAGYLTVNPYVGMLDGIVNTIHLEIPNIVCKLIDIPINDDDAELSDDYVNLLKGELTYKTSDKFITYRRNHRLVKNYFQLDIKPSNYSVKKEGVYIVVGGGHIGFNFIKHILSMGECSICILQRSPLSEQSITNKIGFKSNVSSYAVDIGNFQELENTFGQIKQRYKKINGVLHTAGISGGRLFDHITIDEINQVFKPKVLGAINLFKCIRNENIDFFILCSALSTTTGSYGQTVYNCANSFLNSFSLWANDSGIPLISINWDTWRDSPMIKSLIKKYNLDLNQGLRDDDIKHIWNTILCLYNVPHLIACQDKLENYSYKNSKLIDFNKSNFNSLSIKNNIIDHKNITDKIMQLWSYFLEPENKAVDPGVDFYSNGGTSLIAVQFTKAIREYYNISISPHDLILFPTIKKLSREIYNRLEKDKPSNSPIVRFGNHKGTKNLFFIHPIGGTVLIYNDIFNKLDKKINFFGIQAKYTSELNNNEITVEKIASQYIKHIKSIQPIGPYYIGGASFGGTIAYEILQQFTKQNEYVETLFLLDTPTSSDRPNIELDDSNIITYMLTVGAKHQVDVNFHTLPNEEKINYFIKNSNGLIKEDANFEKSHIKNYLELYRLHFNAMLKYHESKIDTNSNIIYLKAGESDPVNLENPEHGWKILLGEQLKIYKVPGNHITMMQKDNCSLIASTIEEYILSINKKTA